VPGSAYFVPTDEASLTATAGRALQGLGCDNCNGRRMSWYMPGVQSPSLLSGYNLPPPLAGLGRLGAGAGSGRFNRAVARGIYELPFVQVPGQAARGLGQFSSDPVTTILGWIFAAAAVTGLASMAAPGHHRRRRRRA